MKSEEVKALYNELFNSNEALSEEEFLEKLIKIEDITKYNIFRNLLLYTDKTNIKELIKLYWNQIVKSKSVLRSKLERLSLNDLIWEKTTIWEILDKYIERIKKVFSEKKPLSEKLSSLKITYDCINWVIFPPEWNTRIQPWSWKWLNTKEWYDRISLLFNEILNIGNNIYLWDFRVVIGKDNGNLLRKTSYIVIEIPKLNKTIFVNNNYWESTYIYDWIPPDSELLTKWKKSLKDDCSRIPFHNTEQWKNQVSNILFKEGSQNKKKSYKNIKAKDLKNVLYLEEKVDYIRNELNKKEIRKIWFSLTPSSREWFKLNDWTSYIIISRVFWIGWIKHNLYKNKSFIELSKKIFWENDPDVIQLTEKLEIHTIDSIRAIFKKDELLKAIRFSMDLMERRNFKLSDWTSYTSIARIFWFEEIINDLLKKETFICLSKKIFWDDDLDVISLINRNTEHTTEYIRDLFSDDPQLKKEWFTLNYAKRKNYRLNDWTTYANIAKIFGFMDDRDDLIKNSTFLELSKRIFWEDDPDVINLIKDFSSHTIDFIKSVFINDNQVKEEWFSMSKSKRLRFKLKDWTTYIDIAKIFDFKGNRHDFIKDETFIELSKKIFGENDPAISNYINNNVKHTTESIRTIFENDEQLKKQRFSLDIVWRIKFKLPDWTSYTNIARLFGIMEEDNDLFTIRTFIRLNKKIFGEKDRYVTNLSYKNIFHTVDSIRFLFKKDKQLKEKWFSLNSVHRVTFKLNDWTSYISIARIFDITEERKDLFKDKTFIELSKKIFGEKDPDIINFMNTHVEHNIDSIRFLFTNDKQLKEKWFSMDYIQRKAFRLRDWTGYVNIARIFDLKEDREELLKNKGFIEISGRIFGEDDPNVIELSEKLSKK